MPGSPHITQIIRFPSWPLLMAFRLFRIKSSVQAWPCLQGGAQPGLLFLPGPRAPTQRAPHALLTRGLACTCALCTSPCSGAPQHTRRPSSHAGSATPSAPTSYAHSHPPHVRSVPHTAPSARVTSSRSCTPNIKQRSPHPSLSVHLLLHFSSKPPSRLSSRGPSPYLSLHYK